MVDNVPNFELFEWVLPFMQEADNPTPDSKYKYRYLIIHGGRGSGKSTGVVDFLLFKAYTEKHNIVCARQLQKSIETSVYALIKRRIYDLGMEHQFHFTQKTISCKHTGSVFQFIGLELNIDTIRSIDNISYFWIEEGHFIKYYSWEIVKPSVRADHSQIIITMNPQYEDDCLYRAYISKKAIVPETAYVHKLNWTDNPYFTKILNDERLQKLKEDIDMYNHIWEGGLLEASDAQIFRGKWDMVAFDDPPPHEVQYYYGLDFGFNDPTAVVRCYIDNNILYITHDYYNVKVLPTEIGYEAKKVIPNFAESLIIADSSRPDAIVTMKNQGFRVRPSKKGKGSIQDGVQHIKSFDKVVIHERCKATIDEFKNYSYKIDPRSGQVTRIIDDKAGCDHIIDALRYALEPVMKKTMANYSAFAVDNIYF